MRELNIFLGKNYLVTVHSRPFGPSKLRTAVARVDDLADSVTGLFAYLLIDAIVDDYLPLLDKMSDQMD